MYRLGWHGWSAFAALAFVLSVTPSATSATAAVEGNGCHFAPTLRQWVCQVVRSRGSTPGSKPGPRLPTGPGTCSWHGRVFPCSDQVIGWFDNQNGCYYRLATPQPAFDPKQWQGHPNGQGAIYAETCVAINRFRFVWQPSSPAGPPGNRPVQLAQQAFASLILPKPVPPSSPSGARLPDGRPYTVVQVPTWFWTTQASYQAKTARAAVGPVWAQVTVTPVALTFDPGDTSSTVSCTGPGKVWTPQAGQWAHSPGGCDYAYPQSTYGYPGGQLTATYGIVWRATWTGSGGTGGGFPKVTTTATTRFAVAEAQAVILR